MLIAHLSHPDHQIIMPVTPEELMANPSILLNKKGDPTICTHSNIFTTQRTHLKSLSCSWIRRKSGRCCFQWEKFRDQS
jgi:hypothetical protein